MQIRWLEMERNSGGSPAWKVFRRGAQVVDGELAPVTDVGDGVADGVEQTMAISNSWSAMTGASRGDGGARLETTAASVIVGVLETLREREGQGCYSTRQREGRRLGGSRGKGKAEPRRNQRCTAAAPAGSGEEIEQPGGFFFGEKREGRERGAGAL
jgi:hypothetical protein